MPIDPQPAARWYRSFYWRIGLAFFVFVIAVLVAQSAMYTYVIARLNNPFPGRSPNNLSAIVASDLESTLARNPAIDLQAYLTREYGGLPMPVYVVMKDGRAASSRSQQLSDELRRAAAQLLDGTDFKRTGAQPAGPDASPPVVMAPIQVDGMLRGLVVLPPMAMTSPVVRDLTRALSVPGTITLILATAIAALVIFGPARRRLRALEDAAQRFGAGELSARAPDDGADEIAHVASAFNRMAADIAVRDEALRTSDRLRRQMLADVSHELKTPLTAMRGFVETLRMSDATVDAATRARYLETLERETIRLDRIVKDLLDLTRLEHGVGDLDARYFAIRRVFEHVVARHEVEARDRRIIVSAYAAENADQIFADPDRIEQVIENLVANALRHTPDGGRVELYATAGGDTVVLSVVDSGSGIPADHLPHVFDRFYKVDASRAHGEAGSGLGLSITKAIVERHGGNVRVASQPGRTEFTIVLPQRFAASPEVDSSQLTVNRG